MMAIVLEVRVELPVQTAITPIPFKMLGATKHMKTECLILPCTDLEEFLKQYAGICILPGKAACYCDPRFHQQELWYH